MSLPVFTFQIHKPYAEWIDFLTDVGGAEEGREFRQDRLPDAGLFRVFQATIWLAPSRNDLATFHAFWKARKGRYGLFAYKPKYAAHSTVTDEAIGTADGAETDFALDSKYIDESTLSVKVGGVAVAAEDYELVDNEDAPLVRFDAAPSSGAITASYERCFPCRFDQDSMPHELLADAAADANRVIRIQSLTWRQDRPGSHLV